MEKENPGRKYRRRITGPVLVRSTDTVVNTRIVKKFRKRLMKQNKQKSTGLRIRDYQGTKGRFVYIGL